jgi:hypothetical protein
MSSQDARRFTEQFWGRRCTLTSIYDRWCFGDGEKEYELDFLDAFWNISKQLLT